MGKASKALHLARAMKSQATGINLDPNITTDSKKFRNLLMNGDMNVAQRLALEQSGLGASAFTGISTTTYIMDRWRFSASFDGACTLARSTDVPAGLGFPASFKVDVTTVDTSLANGQLAHIQTGIEGRDLQHLAYGTSGAKSLTVSFWVKSTKTGTYCFAILKPDQTRMHFIKEYTINTASTWEKKIIHIDPASIIKASGGEIDNDIGLGFRVIWVLMDGPDRDNGAEGWQADSSGLLTSTSNQVNFFDNTANDFYLTGCQLEVGSIATEFDFIPTDIETTRCKRYYQRYNRNANYAGLGQCVPWSTSNGNMAWWMEVQPRGNPTIEYGHLSHFDYFGVTGAGGGGVPSGFNNAGWAGGNQMDIGVTTASNNFSSARAFLLEFDATATDLPAFLAINAEL